MKKGKSNLDILRNYVEGTRPFIQVGYDENTALKNRKEGEEWEDSRGNRWKKENGIKKKISKKATIINEKRCRICNCDTRWGNYLDDRVWPKTQLCYDCFNEEETRMKLDGTWEIFNKLRDLKNGKSALLDHKSKFEQTKKWCEENKGKPLEFVNEDGSIEKWEGDTSAEQILKDVTSDLGILENRLTEINDLIDGLEKEYESKSKRNNKTRI